MSSAVVQAILLRERADERHRSRLARVVARWGPGGGPQRLTVRPHGLSKKTLQDQGSLTSAPADAPRSVSTASDRVPEKEVRPSHA